MSLKPLVLAALFGLAATTSFAHDYQIGDISVAHPKSFETAPGVKSGGAYMTITNTGDTPDRLIEVRADFPRVMLHNSVTEDGVAKMLHLEGVDIPAGETIELAPGGIHVMLMGLTAPLTVGTEIPATLVFENAGELDVTLNVETRGTDAEDHSSH